jgi:APA family basic amino acid/polyamine antiporter
MVPAVLAALAYAAMASAMPRAGGSYVYASRSLHPYLGLVASFSQWLSLSFAMGVVAYVLVPFVRDILFSFGFAGAGALLESGPPRLALALGFLWISTFVNLAGIKTYERAMIVLMVLGLVGGTIVIATGFAFGHDQFLAAAAAKDAVHVSPAGPGPLSFSALAAAVAILFSSFIGFDSIAQTGSEAKNPHVTLPLATGISILGVGAFYLLFTAALYHAVPWYFIAERAKTTDLTAPGLLGYLLAPAWTAAIVAFSSVALFNSLPGMLLAVSRLMFAWAEDGVFFRSGARIHPRWRTPHVAILWSSVTATLGIFGCHFAGDFFLGVDVLVIGMLVNFTLVCLSVAFLARRNPPLAAGFRVLRSWWAQIGFGCGGAIVLCALLAAQIVKDLRAEVPAWYYRSTWVYLGALGSVSLLFMVRFRGLRRAGVDLEKLYSTLPAE